MADEAIERVLKVINQVFAFKIPPQSSAAGHRADSWPKDPVWTGRLVISAINDATQIQLRDAKTGALFAACPISKDGPPAVTKVVDSSRYFVLRVVDAKSGRHAFIGIAFEDRNDAFDFNVAIDDHQNEVKREEHAAVTAPTVSRDFSLKEGQTIKIKLNKKSAEADDNPAPVKPMAAPTAAKQSDNFGVFSSFASPTATQPADPPSNWETF
ncbi:hypothetical protein H310_02342 [Aphanomyces invadans]|uniref:NECAP PHear domain-containing protein n=1 Tax=Aphanomyces invadans TaxID=157072 RepID=A0A024UNF9_9STRA|nr:hypothetical protein H310_02342 [Aphanomyces invadans]ETW07956.1 hypothetical protein H310_02342 [Aphanomyces invadans]|eukprot:XP_008864049.1 hypothetical protein H310_02342 [Aphanomyces invadans]